MLSHLSSGEGKVGDHDRVTAVAVVGQTLWMNPEPLRCEIRRQNRILQTQGTRVQSWHIDIRRGDLVQTAQDR